MTETFRHSGEYPQQQSAAPVHHGGTQGAYAHGAYPPPPAHAPEAPQLPPQVPQQVPPRRRRARGPAALLAAVAIAAAAVGGGTAYAVQTLTDRDGGSSATSTDVVPTSKKGTVSGVAEAVSPSIVEISATTGQGKSTGSGVITKSDGEIVTNNHVVAGASSIKVRTNDGKTYEAEVVGTDSKKDLALIQLKDAAGLKPATFGNSANVKVGDEVVAIGSPEGLTGTVTSGIVSALERDVTVSTGDGQEQQQNPRGEWPFEFGGKEFNGETGSSKTTYKALQTDASLNPGNSGGALIDMNGNIIGINSAMYAPSSAGSQGTGESGSGSVGLGFAIPIDTVKQDLGKLRSGSQT
ncbi:trypsin-like peptidase domain-containing protein [Streptomyces sp. NPDC046465]|uniref:S1C family serine protease n=1 Tax=Streptomyces sp. NPDC046465 TaxID=3155810 RepID=UPI0033EAA5B1